MGRIVSALLAVLTLPVFAAGQWRGAGSAAPHAAASAPRVVVAPAVRASTVSRATAGRPFPRFTPRSGSTVSVRTGRLVHRSNGAPFNSGQFNFQDVPGLGFDFPHLAAISGNRRLRGSRFNSGFPFGFSGFLLSPPVIVEEVPAAEPQSVAQEDVPVEMASLDSVERPSRAHTRESVPEQSLAPAAPQPDAEQYVFVRRDGSLVFAVAYSWDRGSLRYITPEGVRRTISSDAIDLTATQQFNEQRGLTFRSPA